MIRSCSFITVLCLFAVTSVSYGHTVNPDWIERFTGERIVSRTHSIKPLPPEGDPRHYERTFLTIPEWYIVYSAQEYGTFVTGKGLPSNYQYFSSVAQYKNVETAAVNAAGGWDIADSTTQTVLTTIRLSYTFEMYGIGLYENTVGRLSELLNGHIETREDVYIASIAQEYGAFLNHTPWYAFPYGKALIGLWSGAEPSSFTVRGMERRFAFTIGYGLKYIYASIIGYVSESTYGGAGLTTEIVVKDVHAHALTSVPHITTQAVEGRVLIRAPRYRALRDVLFELAARDISFDAIQGHTRIVFTIVHEPSKSACAMNVIQKRTTAHVLFAYPLLIGSSKSYKTFLTSIQTGSDADYARNHFGAHTLRTAVLVDTFELGNLMYELFSTCGIYTEHVYDF